VFSFRRAALYGIAGQFNPKSEEYLMTQQSDSNHFRYKPNYVAAWPDAPSEAMLDTHGIRRRVHLTTFFDGYGQLASVHPYPWSAPKEARIAAVVEWKVGSETHLVAELDECAWTQVINSHYLAQGVREDYPHRAHLTLDKRVTAGTAAKYQALVGQNVRFDRHGGQVDERPPYMVEGDILLRDWKVQAWGEDKIRVTTPPLGSGIRENHMANKHSLDGDGFYMLARAMLASPRSRGPQEVEQLVETVTMAILGKATDPAPGIDWVCARQWTVNSVRKRVRDALELAGITKATQVQHDSRSTLNQLLGPNQA
jgi:hypothetical protein